MTLLLIILSELVFSGAVQHESLFPTADLSADRPSWAKIEHRSNSYADFGLRYRYDSLNAVRFNEVETALRLEMNQWPMPGFDKAFAGHGIGHLHVGMRFDWGSITLGDVYAQFGSGLILRLYEERSLGVDNSLRGAKINVKPYRGIDLTLLGGKQRRYWNMYNDRAWGWNYTRDAVLGADLELHIEQWSERLRQTETAITFGGSYVSKYQADPEIPKYDVIDGTLYRQVLPNWVGAGDVRMQVQKSGWNALVEYAYKANDPSQNNNYTYDPGQALLMSLGYSQRGLSALVQAKYSRNMYFRSDRGLGASNVGFLNHLPAFTTQQTYALASLYPYATQMDGEWAFQAELRYTCPRKSAMGGRYGTSFRLAASHIRGLDAEKKWAMAKGREGEYYTEAFLEMNKKLSKKWYLNAMLMYQFYDKTKIEGEGGKVESGIGVVDLKYSLNRNVQMRGEAQYLYTRGDEGQWVFLLYELSLFQQLMLSGQWQYNIGGTDIAEHGHYYSAGAAWTHQAHRLTLMYIKTKPGFNCAGGVCRPVPKQEGVNLTYNYTF